MSDKVPDIKTVLEENKKYKDKIKELEVKLKKYTNNERHKKYYEKNKDKIKERSKKYMEKMKKENPEKIKEWKRKSYFKKKEENNTKIE